MSMFDLPTQVSELSGANSGMSNKRFVEVNCSRAVTDSTLRLKVCELFTRI